MIYLVCCFLIFTFQCFCELIDPHVHAVTEGDPTENICDSVNILTGDFTVFSHDAVIEGVEPITLKRFYVSGDGKGFNSNWEFFPHLWLKLDQDEKLRKKRKIVVAEPNGSMLTYKRLNDDSNVFRIDFKKHGKGITNTAKGIISGRTNLKNQITYLLDSNTINIVTAAGGERRYTRTNTFHNSRTCFFLLRYERLPNGNYITYTYDAQDRLMSIHTSNPSRDKIWAWCEIHYERDPEKSHDFYICTSDGKKLQYRFRKEIEEREEGQNVYWVLNETTSTEKDSEKEEYFTAQLGLGPLVKTRHFSNGRKIAAEYYQPNQKNYIRGTKIKVKSRGCDSRVDKVHSLFYPLGQNGSLTPAYQFLYDMPRDQLKHHKYQYTTDGKTDVIDAYGNRTRVTFSPNFMPYRVEYFDETGNLHHLIETRWKDHGEISQKSYLASSGELIFTKKYLYDDKGNVIEEQIIGDLCGEGRQDTYRKNFTYDERNLLIHQEEDDGPIIDFTYLPNTDLPLSKIISYKEEILIREFCEYNSDHILIRKIQDDGKDRENTNLRGVTERKIEIITPKTEEPALGFPQIIEERALNIQTGKEELIKKIILHYSSSSQVIQKDIYDSKDSLSYSLYYTYDTMGRLIEETDPLGQTIKRTLDIHCNKISELLPSGKKGFFTYDSMNRLIQEQWENECGEKRIIKHAYDLKNRRIQTIDAYGNETRFEYDAFDNQIKAIYSDRVESFRYDCLGRVIETIDGRGISTKKRYNAYGKPTQILYPDGTKETYTYFPNGKCKSYTNQEGLIIRYEYDILGREIGCYYVGKDNEIHAQEKALFNSFHLLQTIDKENIPTTYLYDNCGRKIKEERAKESVEFIYDSLGRIHKEKRDAQITIFEKDLLDRTIEDRIEDTEGNVLSKIAYIYNSQNLKTSITKWIQDKLSIEHFTYDAFERLKKYTDPLGYITTYIYDDDHYNALKQKVLQKTTIDPLGRKTIETYNSFSKLASLEKTDEHHHTFFKEEYTYDSNHNLISQKAHIFKEGEFLHTISIHLEYDLLNRKSKILEADGKKITQFSYTPSGKIYQIIKPDQNFLRYSYDLLGNQTSLISSDGTIFYNYRYNRNGGLISVEDRINHITATYELDKQGRILQEKQMNGLTLQNQYDSLGRRIQLTLPDHSQVHYTYDVLHLRRVSYEEHQHDYRFDLAGNLTHENDIFYQRDLKGRAIWMSSPHYKEEVTFDPNGNVLARILDKEKRTYTYNALNQLVSEESPFNHAFTCDSLNNRRSKDSNSYTLNDLNEITSSDTSTFTYDANGNPVLEKHPNYTRHYTYDALDRLIEVIQENFFKLRFTYDHEHRRISKTKYTPYQDRWIEEDKVDFFYDGQNEIGSIDSKGYIRELRILGYAPHAERRATILLKLDGYFYIPIHDLQGNLLKLIYRGSAYEKYDFSAFGEENIPTRPRCPWRFSSKRVDPETGLVFFGRRYYNPSLGRFLTPDPAGFTDSLNLYAYARHNPLSAFDLYGLFVHADADCRPPTRVELRREEERIAREAEKIKAINNFLVSPVSDLSKPFVYQTGGFEHPKRMILFVNGNNYIYQEAIEYAQRMSVLAGGYNIRGIYNPTYGVIPDLLLSLAEMMSGITGPLIGKGIAKTVSQCINAGVEDLLLMPTSNGCIELNGYLKQAPNAIRQKISVLAISPAQFIDPKYCKDVVHYCSARDPVPKLARLLHPFEYEKIRHTVHILEPHPDAPNRDHSILSPTFKTPIEVHEKHFINTGNIR